MKINKLNAVLSGVSGEYFVAAELSRKGYIASITLRNTKGVDILCSNSTATKYAGIQVKTNKGSRNIWVLNEKCETYFAKNLFYVFVKLNNNEKEPEFFVVPSRVVAKFARTNHERWVGTLGRNGKQHINNSMRKFIDIKGKYRDRWDLLKL